MTARPGSTLLGVSLKLYLTPADSVAWALRVADLAREHPAIVDGRTELFVLPSLPALDGVRHALEGTGVAVGAQDLSPFDRGAYTGAVSGADLAEVGCTYAEVGHAERRRCFGEDDAIIGAKLAAATRNGLTPVLCLGESDQVGAEEAVAECARRLRAVLDAAGAPVPELVVAYEPEWAIGAAASADPDHIDRVCAGLRDLVDGIADVASARVIYGGSASPGLLPRLGASVDGLFLGRFAHDASALGTILDETLALR